LCISSFLIVSAVVPPLAADNGPGFNEVVGHMDLTKKTSLHATTYWRDMLGTTVNWTGIVRDVKGGRGKATVFVANKSRSLYKGYNIVLTSFDMDGAANLDLKAKVRFSGQLAKCKNKKGRPIVIYLNNVEFK